MRIVAASIVQRDTPWPDATQIRVHAAGLGRVTPGQFLLAAMAGVRDPVLPRPLLPSWHHQDTGVVDLLYADQNDMSTLPFLRVPAEQFQVFGPLGRPFEVDKRTRRALLVADTHGAGPLVFLARTLVDQGLEVTLIGARTAEGRAMPGTVLPPEVEYVLPQERLPAGDGDPLLDTMETLLPWADALYLSLAAERFPAVVSMLRRRLLRLRKGFAQALVMPTLLPCGIGACDLCTLQTREGMRRLCRDGLVFDLLSLS